jgi:5'-deoxynucleotidase YfbR-like HD superfamily hydrolase
MKPNKRKKRNTPHTKPVACAAKGNILRCLERIPTGNNKRAQAVHQLEKIEMAIQAKEYKSFGASNKSLERFIRTAKKATTWDDLKRLLLLVTEEK